MWSLPSRYRGAIRAEHPFCKGEQDREAVAHLQRMSHSPYDSTYGPGGVQVGDHDEVWKMSHGYCQDILRNVSWEGLTARIHEDGKVLRLSRCARYLASISYALASQPGERGEDLPEVPSGCYQTVRRVSHACNSPRSREIPMALLDLLGNDGAAHRDICSWGHSHADVASARGSVQAGASKSFTGSERST